MPDTTYAIELKGLNLPDEVRKRIDATLRTAVLSEIAKTDLGTNVRVEPLAGTEERLASLPGAWLPLLGFILRGAGAPLVERGVAKSGRTGTPSPSWLPGGTLPLGAGDLAEMIGALYLRPDVRAAIVSNSQALAQLLSRDDEAARIFNDLLGSPPPGGETERLVPLAIGAILLGAAAVGAFVGWLSRP